MTITKNSWKNLKALHAGIYTLKHRYLTDQEKEKINSCLTGNFSELDREKVSFRMQNLVIMLAEQRRDILDIKEYYNLNII